MNARNFSKPVCLGMILAACSLAQLPVPAQKGTVSGTVINTAGAPVREAMLQLTPLARLGSAPDSPAVNSASESDSQGNFTFDDVAPGRYLLAAQRRGYLNASYYNARGGVLTVQPGERATGIVIKMTPQGIIGGRVVDDQNEPLPGATVDIQPYLLSKDQTAIPTVSMAQGKTDADGAFAIGGLPPARYVVSATAPPDAEPQVASPSQGRPEVYVTAYYPDAVDLATATPVELSAGAQVRGLEVRLHKVSVFRVSGKVVSAVTGEAGSGIVVNLFRQGGAPGISARSTGVSTGNFSFDGVLPGAYILETRSAGDAEDRSALVGRQTISVGGRDVDGVVVELQPGIQLTGSVIVEGSPPPAWPQITLTPTEGVDYPEDFVAVDVNGRFTVTGLEPAPYRVNAGSISPPMFIKEIRFNGREIDDAAINLASEQKGFLEIVVSDKASSLTGVVNDSDGPVGPGVLVTAHRTTSGPTRIKQTDESGRFSFTGLPPGEYILTAMDTGTGPAYLAPELLEKHSKVVRLGEGVSATTELRLITMDDLRADSH
ncbi:MAG TPA: carboxypeptidase-like regulatory domain-containing protein [Bryobacteraceae bacterium]|jgi:protocatechuate 3,4-dioxygenase beta subunit